MKKLLALLLAVLLVVTSLLLVACDEEEVGEQGSSSVEGVESDITDEELEEIFETIFGSDFEELFGSGEYDLPPDEF